MGSTWSERCARALSETPGMCHFNSRRTVPSVCCTYCPKGSFPLGSDFCLSSHPSFFVFVSIIMRTYHCSASSHSFRSLELLRLRGIGRQLWGTSTGLPTPQEVEQVHKRSLKTCISVRLCAEVHELCLYHAAVPSRYSLSPFIFI